MNAIDIWKSSVTLLAAALAVGAVAGVLWTSIFDPLLRAMGIVLGLADHVLVHGLSHVYGIRWYGGPTVIAVRWAHLVAIFAGVSLAGAFFESRAAFAALAVGYVGILSIIRVWGWDEEDRREDKPLHRIPGGDFLKEAMFAAACILLLTPILFYRLNESSHYLDVPSSLGPLGYTAFVVGEVVKALPVFDYAEVYGIGYYTGVKPVPPLGQHATFAFRSVLDLILIGGFIQAIEILRRVATGRDLRELQRELSGRDQDEIASAVMRLRNLGMHQKNAQMELVDVLEARNARQEHKHTPEIRGMAANALHAIAQQISDTSLLRAAIDGYRALVTAWPEGSEYWVATQNNLANALTDLGLRIAGPQSKDRLVEAVATLRTTLATLSPIQQKPQWLATMNGLAVALAALAERNSGAEKRQLLMDSADAFRAVRDACDRESAAMDWAMAQGNLGNALRELGELESSGDGNKRLAEAIEAFRGALGVYSKKKTPLQWAQTQNNLGNALHTLGEREVGQRGVAFLREAAVAYRGALRVYVSREQRAFRAAVQNHLGMVLRSLGERLGGKEGVLALRRSVTAHRAALAVYSRSDRAADWAATQTHLGSALRALGVLVGGAEGRRRLNEAVLAYRSALEEVRREDSPADWALIQTNLGNALVALGERDLTQQGMAQLEEAIEAYALALQVHTRKEMPLQWAAGQYGLGNAHAAIGVRLDGNEGCSRLERAMEVFGQALDVYTEVGATQFIAMVERALARVQAAYQARCSSVRRNDHP